MNISCMAQGVKGLGFRGLGFRAFSKGGCPKNSGDILQLPGGVYGVPILLQVIFEVESVTCVMILNVAPSLIVGPPPTIRASET